MSSRIRTLRVEAVVLRHYDWGEADRILTLFTLELGKVRAIAKGVRKMKSRKAGHLEPFTRTSLLLAKGRDLYIVTQAETVRAFDSLRGDLVSLGYASYVIELLDRFTYEEGENRAMYRLLVDTLARLASGEDADLVVRYYEIRLLDLLGYRPHLFTCAVCEEEIQPQDQFFSARLGGVVCPSCGRNEPGVRPISLQALKYLRHFQRSRFSQARRARIPAEVNREMEILMQHYLTYLLERGLNSPIFLRRVRQEADVESPEEDRESKS
jgi:DNA repair protein RecO (recombination protein O)